MPVWPFLVLHLHTVNHLIVLRIQTLLIRIRIMLFTLIRIRIWILLFSLIRIRLFYTDPDPYRFKKAMYLKQYPTYFIHLSVIFFVNRLTDPDPRTLGNGSGSGVMIRIRIRNNVILTFHYPSLYNFLYIFFSMFFLLKKSSACNPPPPHWGGGGEGIRSQLRVRATYYM